MTEADALAELTRLDGEFGQMVEDERRHFENLLYLRAMIHGWTGDPLCQPATSVLAALPADADGTRGIFVRIRQIGFITPRRSLSITLVRARGALSPRFSLDCFYRKELIR